MARTFTRKPALSNTDPAKRMERRARLEAPVVQADAGRPQAPLAMRRPLRNGGKVRRK